jgi:hypothetical protein
MNQQFFSSSNYMHTTVVARPLAAYYRFIQPNQVNQTQNLGIFFTKVSTCTASWTEVIDASDTGGKAKVERAGDNSNSRDTCMSRSSQVRIKTYDSHGPMVVADTIPTSSLARLTGLVAWRGPSLVPVAKSVYFLEHSSSSQNQFIS